MCPSAARLNGTCGRGAPSCHKFRKLYSRSGSASGDVPFPRSIRNVGPSPSWCSCTCAPHVPVSRMSSKYDWSRGSSTGTGDGRNFHIFRTHWDPLPFLFPCPCPFLFRCLFLCFCRRLLCLCLFHLPFRHCCNLLLEGFELCDGALHGGQVRCVVNDEAGVCLVPLLVSDPETTLFSSKYAPGSLTLPPGVTMPRGLAAAPARNTLSDVVGLEDQRVMG